MQDNLKWFSIARKSIPGIIHGLPESNAQSVYGPVDWNGANKNDMFVAYAELPKPTTPLVIAVVPDGNMDDLLSWLSTYAAEVFPISQTVRVLGLKDWKLLEAVPIARTPFPKESLWPSVIIGEMLGQGETDSDVANLPLSRAFACFSFAQARTSLIYDGNPELGKRCAERLDVLENDPAFVRRVISVRQLLHVWAFASDDFSTSEEVKAIIACVTKTLDGGVTEPEQYPRDFYSLELRLSRISSGSIEGRVIEFERAVEALLAVAIKDQEVRQRIPLLLASLAILLGGGTSHISLLEEYGKSFPTVYAWFGLLAGLSGPKSWDANWLRVATSVERMVRSTFSRQDPPTADLCWAEYNWIRELKQSSLWFKEAPKLFPRLLSVEVIPGSSCQLRLLGEPQNDEKDRTAAMDNRNTVPPEASRAAREASLKLIMTMDAQLHFIRENLETLRREVASGDNSTDLFGGRVTNHGDAQTKKRAPSKRKIN